MMIKPGKHRNYELRDVVKYENKKVNTYIL